MNSHLRLTRNQNILCCKREGSLLSDWRYGLQPTSAQGNQTGSPTCSSNALTLTPSGHAFGRAFPTDFIKCFLWLRWAPKCLACETQRGLGMRKALSCSALPGLKNAKAHAGDTGIFLPLTIALTVNSLASFERQ